MEIDPNTGKTLSVDLQLLPYNRRDVSTIKPRIVQRMKEGGEVTTDFWRAYPEAVRAAGCTHLRINHSEYFVDSEGVHSNNVEGERLY